MTASNWQKMAKQLESKPSVLARFVKNNKPRVRKFGISAFPCVRCGRFGAHIKCYGLNLCRQCFRENAKELGFKKYH